MLMKLIAIAKAAYSIRMKSPDLMAAFDDCDNVVGYMQAYWSTKKMDEHFFNIGPFSLEFLKKLIAQAHEDGASGICLGVDKDMVSTKVKVRLVENEKCFVKNLYYIIKGDEKLGQESLGRVVTSIEND